MKSNVGSLLIELSALERTQPDFLCSGVAVRGEDVFVSFPERVLKIDSTADRESIAKSLRESGYEVRSSFEGALPPMNFVPGPHESWIEFLNDLGTYEQDMDDICPGLGYEEVKRLEKTVEISLKCGSVRISREFTLDSMPVGVPVDLAFDFKKILD
ncbi:hypothetical protein [Paeniglutamicibacter antarcticus]|uniref:Uncharacterized protein n=1 Tax=Paeniglutamicibacter antarcticus TaxID=494023 RepID=A0ABP9TK93_9MICC